MTRWLKSNEEKLRERGGQTASATVLDRHAVSEVSFFGSQDKFGRFRYRLRVEPAGEPSFEADAAIDARDVYHEIGDATFVIYDPADRSRVAIDERAIQARDAARFKASVPRQEILAKLTALRDAGGLSEADFEKAKAKLVDG